MVHYNMMSDQTDNLISLIKPYGLSAEESRIYIFLLRNGFSTALHMSRTLKIGRTKVYRLLDVLQKKQLLETKVDERGMKFGSAHPNKFNQLISIQEQTVASLKQTLPDLISQLNHILPQAGSSSKVLYYEGVEGLKQVSYNITRAQGLLRVFEMEHLSDFVSKDYAEMIRLKLVEKGIFTRDLTNKKSFSDYTNVTEMIGKFSEFRHVPPEKLKINFEVLIYNDVYTTYTYKNDVVFCVEIYNEHLAEMQKQIFDFIWNQARRMKFISNKGAAKLA